MFYRLSLQVLFLSASSYVGIRVDEKGDCGATFTLQLPRAKVDVCLLLFIYIYIYTHTHTHTHTHVLFAKKYTFCRHT